MLYHAFDLHKNWLAGASALATAGAQVMQHPANPLGYFGGSPMFASALEVFAHAAAPRGKPILLHVKRVIQHIRIIPCVARRRSSAPAL